MTDRTANWVLLGWWWWVRAGELVCLGKGGGSEEGVSD